MKVDVFKYNRVKVGFLKDRTLTTNALAICDYIFYLMNVNRTDEVMFCASYFSEVLPFNRKTISDSLKQLIDCKMVEIVGYQTKNKIPVVRFSNSLYIDKFKNSRVRKTDTRTDTIEDTLTDTTLDTRTDTLYNDIEIISSNKLEDEISVNDIIPAPDFQIQKNEGVSYFENPTTKRMQECDLFQQYRTNANFIISALRNIPAIAKYLTHENAQTTITELHNEFKFNNGATSQHPNTNEWFKHFQNFCKLELNRRAKEDAKPKSAIKTRKELFAEVDREIQELYRRNHGIDDTPSEEVDTIDSDFEDIS